MKVFRNREEAEKAGFVNFGRAPDQSLLFMHGKTAERATVRTPLEAMLAAELEAREWSSPRFSPGSRTKGGMACPRCDQFRSDGHKPDCKLSAALKAFRGEAS